MIYQFPLLRVVATRLRFVIRRSISRLIHQTKQQCAITSQHGSSLIEVLVSLLIITIAVLGAASLQVNALKFNTAAKDHAAASILAYNIIDRMRANRDSALNGDYDLNLVDDAPTDSSIPANDLQQWLNALNERLPEGDASISRSAQTFTITVQWQEGRLSASREASAPSTESYLFVTEL